MKNIFVNLDNDISTKSILLITEDLEYINHLRDSSNIKYDLIKFDKKNNQLLSNLLFDYDVIIYDNKKNDLIEFITAFRISYLNNFNIPIIILDDELSFDLSNDKFSNVFTVLPRDINKKRFLLNIKLCINYISFNKKIILINGFYFDMNSGILLRNREIIELTNIERKLVSLLIKNINRLVTYEIISSIVWKNKKYSIYGLRNAIKSIRQKTEDSFIENSSSNGYIIKGV